MASAKPTTVVVNVSGEDLQRNDVEGALAVARVMIDEGSWTPAAWEWLLMMQDDPSTIEDRLSALVRGAGSKGAPTGVKR